MFFEKDIYFMDILGQDIPTFTRKASLLINALTKYYSMKREI